LRLPVEGTEIAFVETAGIVLLPPEESYTGEPMAEITLHGNPLLLQTCVEVLELLGARLAEPGEFTRRAFLSGRMDLTQAEAVAEIVAAQNREHLRLALSQAGGALFREVKGWIGTLIATLASIEVAHDYPGEISDASLEYSGSSVDGEEAFHVEQGVAERVAALADALAAEVAQARGNEAIRRGITVVIMGPPNTGKSTLFNALLGRVRAVVSPESGTTRDYITEDMALGIGTLKLVDTAGLRAAGARVEAEGIRLGLETARQADVLVWLDSADGILVGKPAEMPPEIADLPHVLAVVNKVDLAGADGRKALAERLPGALLVSALHGEGVGDVRAKLERLVSSHDWREKFILNLRQTSLIEKAEKSLRTCLASLADGMPTDVVAIDLREAMRHLSAIVKADVSDAVLDAIFSSFCVGK
jgi:tRNA modification GTPase